MQTAREDTIFGEIRQKRESAVGAPDRECSGWNSHEWLGAGGVSVCGVEGGTELDGAVARVARQQRESQSSHAASDSQ